MSDVQTRFSDGTGNKRPAVWKDRKGTVHVAVGAEIHRGIRLMWTACGKKDIPANSAWLMGAGDAVTCPDCEKVDP